MNFYKIITIKMTKCALEVLRWAVIGLPIQSEPFYKSLSFIIYLVFVISPVLDPWSFFVFQFDVLGTVVAQLSWQAVSSSLDLSLLCFPDVVRSCCWRRSVSHTCSSFVYPSCCHSVITPSCSYTPQSSCQVHVCLFLATCKLRVRFCFLVRDFSKCIAFSQHCWVLKTKIMTTISYERPQSNT